MQDVNYCQISDPVKAAVSVDMEMGIVYPYLTMADADRSQVGVTQFYYLHALPCLIDVTLV
jgi:hypothetical protein